MLLKKWIILIGSFIITIFSISAVFLLCPLPLSLVLTVMFVILSYVIVQTAGGYNLSLKFNLKLSQKRAQSVMNYLVQNNIAPGHLRAMGQITPDSPQKEADENFRCVLFKASIGAE